MTHVPPDGDGRADVAGLAELDAGLPDDASAARRRVAAAADPDARAVLDALAAARADLAALPAPEVPPAVAARWTAALAAESDRRREPDGRTETPFDDRAEPRPVAPPPRGRATRGGRAIGGGRRLLVAAAAVVAVAGVGAVLHRPGPPREVTPVELVALGRASVGTTDLGDLADPARRAACLGAVAPAAVGERLLGGRRVVLDGRPGILLVLATGTRGGLRIVTVDPACGPAGGTLLAQVAVV